jgi:hypothetical protein
VCSMTFDQNFQMILTVHFTHDFLPALTLALAMVTDLWACIIRGPLIGERSSVAECVFPRRRTETRWLCVYFGSLAKGKIIFPHVILCSSTVERTALATRPSSAGTGHDGHRDGGPLPASPAMEREGFPHRMRFFFPLAQNRSPSSKP